MIQISLFTPGFGIIYSLFIAPRSFYLEKILKMGFTVLFIHLKIRNNISTIFLQQILSDKLLLVVIVEAKK